MPTLCRPPTAPGCSCTSASTRSRLAGEGFELVVAEGAEVTAGADVVVWDPAAVEAGGRSPICPVVALDAAAEALSDARDAGDLAAGDPLFAWAR